MGYTITESRPISSTQNLCTIFIESLAALDTIPEPIMAAMAIGSTAYTKDFTICFLTSKGWEVAD